MINTYSIRKAAAALTRRTFSAEELLSACFKAIDDGDGQGMTAFVALHREAAFQTARYYDQMRSAGAAIPTFAGIPIAVKDNFDEAGVVSTAGSKVFAKNPAATHDAPVLARLKAAGFIPIGRTNMTEFAYSGLGLNPHHGSPLSPFGRSQQRISGGSSSGSAVAVADGMALGGLGTDTGGSCRIPAAFCGLTGMRPTQSQVPLDGIVPLSPSLDAVGPLARTVDCCDILYRVMVGQRIALDENVRTPDLANTTFAIPLSVVMEGLETAVADAFANTVRRLKTQGARIIEIDAHSLNAIAQINAKGGFAAAEAYAFLDTALETQAADFDPRVSSRILRGTEQSAADFIQMVRARADLKAAFAEDVIGYGAVLMPTTPILAPKLGDLADDETYSRINLLALRNPSIANLLDRPAISLPVMTQAGLPMGVTLMGKSGNDNDLLALCRSVEQVISDS